MPGIPIKYKKPITVNISDWLVETVISWYEGFKREASDHVDNGIVTTAFLRELRQYLYEQGSKIQCENINYKTLLITDGRLEKAMLKLYQRACIFAGYSADDRLQIRIPNKFLVTYYDNTLTIHYI